MDAMHSIRTTTRSAFGQEVDGDLDKKIPDPVLVCFMGYVFRLFTLKRVVSVAITVNAVILISVSRHLTFNIRLVLRFSLRSTTLSFLCNFQEY